jgi:hypothetical protein
MHDHKCPFCAEVQPETVLVAHISKAHNQNAYAWTLATALRLGHQEQAKELNEVIRVDLMGRNREERS